MTIDELYGKVIADEDLKAEFAKAASDGKIAEWVAAQGVAATEDEIIAYAKAAANKKLALDDVNNVAGGDDSIFRTATWGTLECYGDFYDK